MTLKAWVFFAASRSDEALKTEEVDRGGAFLFFVRQTRGDFLGAPVTGAGAGVARSSGVEFQVACNM